MHVLLIGSFDSTNYALAPFGLELARRGHTVSVAVLDPEDTVNNRIFKTSTLPLKAFDEVDGTFMDTVDFVVGAPIKPKSSDMVYRLAYERNIMVCAFATLFSSVTMRVKPDIVFALGDDTIDEFKSNHLDYRFVKTGNPQYDSLLPLRDMSGNGLPKRVLFIDQGGYPYGDAGKTQLAHMLIRIAVANPDMAIDVKLRYRPEDGGAHLHTVPQNLAQYLNTAPDNLRVLNDTRSIEEILGSYDALLAMWSTVHMAAIVADMPLLLVSGFDSDDVFDVRIHRIRQAYEHLEESGCVARFDEIGPNLARCFRRVNADYAHKAVAHLGESACEIAANRIEDAYEQHVLTGKRYAYVGDKTRLIDVDSAEFRMQSDYFEAVNTQLQELVFLNRCMGDVLDLSFADAYLAADLPDAGKYDIGIICKEACKLLRNDFIEAQRVYFTSAVGMRALEEDAILQDFYFDWLYDAGDYDAIEHPRVSALLAPESRTYNLARVRLAQHRISQAYDLLFEYLHQAHAAPTTKFLKFKRIRECIDPFRKGPYRALYYLWLSRPANRSLARKRKGRKSS